MHPLPARLLLIPSYSTQSIPSFVTTTTAASTHQTFNDMCQDEHGLTHQDYMLLHPRCAVCHWPLERRGRWLELHHIVGGPGRKNPPDGSNWIALCGRCHCAVHDRLPEYGELPKGAVLSAKEEEDGPVDAAKLAALKGRRALPYEREPIPEKFLRDRTRRGGDPWP